jgi:hypothetical protein
MRNFDEGFGEALARVADDEAWLRGLCDSAFDGPGMANDADEQLHVRQARTREALGFLCKQAVNALASEKRAEARVPQFGLPADP